MRLLSVILISSMLAACGGNPVKTSFPDIPEKLMVDPGKLKTLRPDSLTTTKLDDSSDSEIKLSTVGEVVTENYKTANKWRELILELQLWIKTQKSINP